MRPVAIANPPNPWASTEVEYLEAPPPEMRLEVYEDHSRQVLAQNDSPDVGFRYSVNPYRGCFHGCAYCYARPSHEYLSFGAGTDFERRIVIKPRAPELLREAFSKRGWKRDTVVFSGVTDCYQPLEASYRLTRGCLEVCAEMGNPAAIITKAPLIERDIDASDRAACPRGCPCRAQHPVLGCGHGPGHRTLRGHARAASAHGGAAGGRGLTVGVNVAPIIPGLNDRDIPRILAAARDAGATSAGYVLLRLPGSVREVFVERLRRELPLAADRVLHLVRETRGGELYDPRFSGPRPGRGPLCPGDQDPVREHRRPAGPHRERHQELDEPAIAAKLPDPVRPARAAKRSNQLRLFLPE